MFWQGGREGEGGSSFAMDCLISRTLKCEHQIKRLGPRRAVALRGGENVMDLHKWAVERKRLSLGVCLPLCQRPGWGKLCSRLAHASCTGCWPVPPSHSGLFQEPSHCALHSSSFGVPEMHEGQLGKLEAATKAVWRELSCFWSWGSGL